MGYNPFWPTSLATVNVLVVAASQISQTRFDEIFRELSKCGSLDLRDVDVAQLGSDLVYSDKSQNGSILFNYSRSASQSGNRRFPLELNAEPQLILGVFEPSQEEEVQSEEASTHAVRRAQIKLSEHSEHLQNGCTTVLINLNPLYDQSSASVLELKTIDEEDVFEVVKKATRLFIRNTVTLTAKLTDLQLTEPESAVRRVNGSTAQASHVSSATSVDKSPKDQQPSPDPANVATHVSRTCKPYF